MQNYPLDSLNDAINIENGNKESLERLARILYNVDASAKSSVKINEGNGIFYIKDWSGQIAGLAVGRGANFYGLILGATASLSGAALLAEKRRLYEIGTGLNFSPLAGAPVSKPANKPARGTAKEKKEAQNNVIFGGWHTPNGLAISNYFASKTGVIDTDFLDKYKVEPIAKVEFSTGKKTPNFDASNFAFSYKANDWIKKIQPDAPKELKTLVLKAGANNYVFGLEQLPDKDENLFIFEGESDVICASWHGFNAVCFGGAAKPILPQIARGLKDRFKRVFVLFDNDNAGKINGKQLAEKHGFIYVDTERTMQRFFAGSGLPLPEGIKDVCDIHKYFNAYNAATAKQQTAIFLRFCSGTNGRIYPLEKDRFSSPIPHVTIIPFRQYISEKTTVLDASTGANIDLPYIHKGIYNPLQILALNIAKDKKVCLQAAAGAGKSTALIDLIKSVIFDLTSLFNTCFLEYLGAITRVVIAVPTIPLAEQLYTAFSGKDRNDNIINAGAPLPNCTLITGEKSVLEKRASVDSSIIICTYDSVLIAGITENTILIVDEAHQIITEKGYRNSATKSVLAAIKQANYTLLLSATPNYLFNEYFGFKLVLAVAEITNIKHINICEYTGEKDFLLAYIIDKVKADKNKKGTVLIKLDNSTLLRAGAMYAKSLGLTSEIFTAKTKSKGNYISILNTSKLSTKVDIIFSTCLIEAGVSIKDEIKHIYICDTLNTDKIIQQLARPRFDASTGANYIINATIFVNQNKTAKEKEKGSGEILQVVPAKINTMPAKKEFDYMLKLVSEKANNFNQNSNIFETVNIDDDPKDSVIYELTENKDTGEIKENYFEDVLILMYELILKSITKDVNLLSERLKYTDKTIQSVSFTNIVLSENQNFLDCKNAIDSIKEKAEKQAIFELENIFYTGENEFKLVVFKALQSEKNAIKRSFILKNFGLNNDKTTRENANIFYNSLSDASREKLQQDDANILKFISTLSECITLPNISTFDALIMAKNGLKHELNAVKYIHKNNKITERMKRSKSDKKTRCLSPKERNICDTANDVIKAFKTPIHNISTGSRKKPFTLLELAKITNTVLVARNTSKNFKPKTEKGANSAKAYLETFFDISEQIIEKKTYYNLSGKKTLSDNEISEKIASARISDKQQIIKPIQTAAKKAAIADKKEATAAKRKTAATAAPTAKIGSEKAAATAAKKAAIAAEKAAAAAEKAAASPKVSDKKAAEKAAIRAEKAAAAAAEKAAIAAEKKRQMIEKKAAAAEKAAIAAAIAAEKAAIAAAAATAEIYE